MSKCPVGVNVCPCWFVTSWRHDQVAPTVPPLTGDDRQTLLLLPLLFQHVLLLLPLLSLAPVHIKPRCPPCRMSDIEEEYE